MSTDLITIDNNTSVMGLDGFTLRAVTYKLTQPMTQTEGVLPGLWMNTLDSSTEKEIEVIPLSFSKQRGYYPAGSNDFSGPPVCYSMDALKPSPKSEAIQSASCSNCVKAKWGPNRGEKPECRESYKMTALLTDSRIPINIFFRGTHIAPLNMFIQVLQTKIISAKNKGEGDFKLRDFSITLGSKQVPGKTKYFVPVFKNTSLHGMDIEAEYEMYVRQSLPLADEEELGEELEQHFESV